MDYNVNIEVGNLPLVSVLIPIYGTEKYIERCARSLFEQTLSDVEFIFVNDGSKDKSFEVLDRVMREYEHRKVFVVNHDKNRGLAAARKTAFLQARGKYVICCDSDDWVEKDMYERMVVEAEQANADIVCCGIYKETSISEKCYYDYEEDDTSYILSPKFFGWIYGAIWNKLIRTDFMKEHAILPWEGINMWEDSCLTLRLRTLSKKTIIMKECFYHYNLSNEESMTFTFKKSKVLEMMQAVVKIEDFFKKQGFDEESKELVDFLKISSKEVLLRFPSKENIHLFKYTFPEVKNNILALKTWSLALRLRAYFVSILPVTLSVIILNAQKKISQLLEP